MLRLRSGASRDGNNVEQLPKFLRNKQIHFKFDAFLSIAFRTSFFHPLIPDTI